MRTQRVAALDLDPDRLRDDLEALRSLPYDEPYDEYVIGNPWKSCMLWAAGGGDTGGGVIVNYDQSRPAGFTEHARCLPYLKELISRSVDTDRLIFVRVAVHCDSLLVPHRDYVELQHQPEEARCSHRLHIPLATNDDCFFCEEETVFQMKPGEVWFLDVTRMHSAASMSKQPRVHLIFDFNGVDEGRALVRVGGDQTGTIPPERVVDRPGLPVRDRQAIHGLAELLTMDTYRDVLSILLKLHYRYQAGADFVWDSMLHLARRCRDPRVLPHTVDLHRFTMLERSA